MTIISSKQAVALAESFISDKRTKYKCGEFSSVRHKPVEERANEEGTFYVEFSYAGPPMRQKTNPPSDHPTIVLVNDKSGECRVMYWM